MIVTLKHMSVFSSLVKSSVSTITTIFSEIRLYGTAGKEIERCLKQHDIVCTLKTIEGMCIMFQDIKVDSIYRTVEHVVSCVRDLHIVLEAIRKKIIDHNNGYLSRWKHLNLENDISEIGVHMRILMQRFDIMCKCITIGHCITKIRD